MRFAHARPAAVTLVAGGVLITATSGFSLGAVLGTTAARADLSGYAVAADDAAAGTGALSCEPFKTSTPLRRQHQRRRRRRAHANGHFDPVEVAVADRDTKPEKVAVSESEDKRQPGKHIRPRRRR